MMISRAGLRTPTKFGKEESALNEEKAVNDEKTCHLIGIIRIVISVVMTIPNIRMMKRTLLLFPSLGRLCQR
jgi:hypothetical protein